MTRVKKERAAPRIEPGPLAPEARIMPLDQAATRYKRAEFFLRSMKFHLHRSRRALGWTADSERVVSCFSLEGHGQREDDRQDGIIFFVTLVALALGPCFCPRKLLFPDCPWTRPSVAALSTLVHENMISWDVMSNAFRKGADHAMGCSGN